MISDEAIEKAKAGDPETLVELDAAGLLLGRGETALTYGERLECLRRNFAAMNEALEQQGRYEVEGVTVRTERRIPVELFAEAAAVTEPLYRFAIDWVPGFFINPRLSLLFGGCAFFFYPDFFVLFIIRRSFEHRRRWLIYGRRELLAHELCHVARIGLGSQRFEETMAYQTSVSGFRRVAGSMFQRPADSLAFLGSTMVLLAAQVLRTSLVPTLPIWPFWGLIALIMLLLLGRHTRLRREYAAALAHAAWLAPEDPAALLFRCTDEEVSALAALPSAAEAEAWLAARCEEELRWRIIRRRFYRDSHGYSGVPQASAPASARS